MNVNRYAPLTIEMQQSVELDNLEERMENTREIFNGIDDYETEDDVKDLLKIEWEFILKLNQQTYDRHPLNLKRRDSYISEMREDINHIKSLIRDRELSLKNVSEEYKSEYQSVTDRVRLELRNKEKNLENYIYQYNDFTLCQLRDIGY